MGKCSMCGVKLGTRGRIKMFTCAETKNVLCDFCSHSFFMINIELLKEDPIKEMEKWRAISVWRDWTAVLLGYAVLIKKEE